MLEGPLRVLLALEALLCLVLVVPLGNRLCQRVVERLDRSFGGPGSKMAYASHVMLAVVAVAFLANTSAALAPPAGDDGTRIAQLLAERDALLSGAALFLLLMLRLLYAMLKQNNKQAVSLFALEKQSRGLLDSWNQMSDEADALKQESAELLALVGGDELSLEEKRARLQRAFRERDEAREEAARAAEEAQRVGREMEALKKQAAAQADAYMGLMTDKERLERRLDDFSDVMPERAKKHA